jgi:hypothetical protein
MPRPDPLKIRKSQNDKQGTSLSEQSYPEARTRLGEAEAYKKQRTADAIGETSRGEDPAKAQLYVIDWDKERVPLHLKLGP